ncbi:MAG: adenosylhomocysteinase [Oscillospiraceae bacterium]|nr:adenosylhomocysteinase [Oscillospiraceae bacterium]
MDYRVKDIALAEMGEQKIDWVKRNMPLLESIERDFADTKPFAGLKFAVSVHIEAKTARFCRMLRAAGAEVYATGCNPLSTQDDVAAALAASGIAVFAVHGASAEEYTDDLKRVLACSPNFIVDDGADLAEILHTSMADKRGNVIGGCEETTTGINRLAAMGSEGILRYPVMTVNNARCKYLFDNRYGTGQSVWDGINRTTNLVVAGKNVVIAGYGWCGKGAALRAKGLGAHVIVTEIDPVKALEAHMDGFTVMPMHKAAREGDLFVTVTGCKGVITNEHFAVMKDGAVMCNAGHFNAEIDVDWLAENADSSYEARNNIRGYVFGGKTLFVLAEGRLVNLAGGDGHPAEIMDMSFAIQALSAEWLIRHRGGLTPGLYAVPEEIDFEVASRKLQSLGLGIDVLSEEQKRYLNSWAL